MLILETVMNEFLHINDKETENMTDGNNVTAKEIVKEYVYKNAEDEDIELYEMMANDFSETIEDINSAFLSEGNRPSFVALVGYADRIGKSQLLNDWLPEFEKKQDLYANQKQNFLHMKQDFEQYLKKCA